MAEHVDLPERALGKVVALGRRKVRARTAENVLLNMIRRRKRRAKGIDQEALVKKKIQFSSTTRCQKDTEKSI